MAGAQTSKIVPFHAAGKALADANATGVHILAGREVIDGKRCANLEKSVGIDPEFAETVLRLHLGLGVMAAHGLAHILDLGRAHAQLYRRIAARVLGRDRHHLAVVHLEYGDRNMHARIVKDARHTEFAGNDS